MMIEKRPALLLKFLLKTRHASMSQLMDEMHLTKRQISYDLEKVNHWLKESELPVIPYKGGNYIIPPKEVVEHFQNQPFAEPASSLILTEEERLLALYLYLFIRHQPIASVHLTQLLQVSKNTIISDVKKANESNRNFLVEIRYTRQKGYHLVGTEFDKRIVVMHHLAQLYQGPYAGKIIDYLLSEHEQIHFENVFQSLKQLEKEFELQFVEERLTQFASFLLFYYCRQKERKFVKFHSDELIQFRRDPMWNIAEKLLGCFPFKQEETEVCYLTIQLLGLSLGNQTSLYEERDLLLKLSEQLVFDFESKAAIAFEKKNQVIHSLYQHLKPAYFRMKYRIPINNPLLAQIKSEHKELFTIVKEMLMPIGGLLNITIPEEEIGFITIHFGALLERPKQTVPKKKRAIVVCPSGISSSLMVKHQLESLFSEIVVDQTMSVEEYLAGEFQHCDLLFSTVEIETKLPCFYVKPIMTPNEKNHLVNEVYQHLFGIQYQGISVKELIQAIGQYANIYDEKGLKLALSRFSFQKKVDEVRGKQPVLNELIKNDTIQMVERLSDWEEAIKVAATPLLEQGDIQASYIDAMIENIKTIGPYVVIGPEVAIPHARPEMGVNQVGMSFLKLKEPVHFLNDANYPVRLIFCIAAVDNTTHLKALSQLTKLLSEKNNVETLKNTDSKDHIQDLFKQYSTAQ